MGELKILSLNANGLNDPSKIRAIHHEYQNSDIIFFQESKINNPQTITLFKNIFYRFKLFWSPSEGNSGGLITLIKKSIQITDTIVSKNYLISDLKIENLKYRLINIYCPTKVSQRMEVLKEIEFAFFSRRIVILGGDFNFIPNSKIDKQGGNLRYGTKGQNLMHNYCRDFLLLDIWRYRNPNKKQFTWQRNNIKTRLDRFYISDEISLNIKTCKIRTNPFSDHCDIYLEVLTNYNDEDKIWKCNPETFEEARDDIIQAINQIDKNQEFWWDTLKFRFKNSLMLACSRIETMKNLELNNLKKRLESQLKLNENAQTIYKTKQEIISKIKEKASGIFIRSRAQIYFEGERPTRMFLKQEKQRGKTKNITALKINDAEEKDQQKIREHMFSHYKKLFQKTETHTQHENIHEKFLQAIDPIDEQTAQRLDKPISYPEIIIAIKNLKNNTSPGSDGLSKEFYMHFRDILTPVLKDMMTDIINNDTLFPTQKYAIIRLIPKSDDPEELKHLKNWRPISLLNTDYKIFTKILTDRLAIALHDKINPCQSCVPGRDIADNLHILRDVIDITNKRRNSKLALYSNDYANAFDTLSHDFIHKVLAAYGLGSGFRSVIRILYSDAKSMIYTNKISKAFKISRGIRQGDPLSMLLFATCIDPMIQHIQKNPEISGFRLGTTNIKLIAHADDINFFAADQKDIKTIYSVINEFSKISGLHPNCNKCTILNIGTPTLRHPQITSVNEAKFLGIYVDKTGLTQTNITKMKESIFKSTTFWDRKTLSIKGKICVANTILAPKLWYALKIMPTNKSNIRDFQRQLERYIWNRKIAPDSERIYAPEKQGGLRLVNILTKMHAFKTKLVLDLINKQKPWETFGKYWLGFKLRTTDKKFRTNNYPFQTKPNKFYETAYTDYLGTLGKIKTIERHHVNYIYKKTMVTQLIKFPTLVNYRLFDHKLISAKQESLNWKIFSKELPVGEWRLERDIIQSRRLAACPFCNKTESLLHLFVQCHIARLLQHKFHLTYNFKIEGLETHILLSVDNLLNTKQILALTIYRDFIWQSRNRAVFDLVKSDNNQITQLFQNYIENRKQYGLLKHGSFPF